jgi:antirestriction protein ArdC
MAKADPYKIITDNIIKMMSKGIIPWQKPWTGEGTLTTPRNIKTGRVYSGINFFILASSGYTSPLWMSFKEAVDKGGTVRKYQKSTPIQTWFITKLDADGNVIKFNDKTTEVDKKIFTMKYRNVFNLEQVDGIVDPSAEPKEPVEPVEEFNPIESAEAIASTYLEAQSLEVKHDQQRAFYSPVGDYINLPTKESFCGSEEYYSTLFHEIGHSTGHGTRLKRKGIDNFDYFGSHQYSEEELVAEFTACYLCGEAGILNNTQENSVAYIQNWAKKLKEDKKLIFKAVQQATKSANYVLGKVKEPAEATK